MRYILCLVLCFVHSSIAHAQVPSTLVADQIDISPDGELIATGNVLVYQGDTQLSASRISFDGASNTLVIQGPLRLKDGNGSVILASQAEMSQSLRTGILKSARLILNQQVQLAAAEISRVNDRYTQAYQVAATSCQVCAGKTPIWQIRAKRIVHDTAEQQLYFEQAQLRVFDIPVFYFPQMRLPDPNLDRASGFLVPRFKNSTALGLGLKIPYFVRLGDHKDLTLAPFLSSGTRTLEFRYRQTVASGNFSFDGAISRDDILNGQTRGYLFGSGTFDLARDYILEFDLQAVKDPTYLFDYGYANTDRLKSSVEVTRAERHKNVELRLSGYQSLRTNDDNATLPTLVTEGVLQRRFFPKGLGGEIDYNISFLGSYRYSDDPVNGAGFDVVRLSAATKWHRTHTFTNGIVANASAKLELNQYAINQHDGFDTSITRGSGVVTAGLGWPLSRRAQGRTDVIEPRLQIDWSEISGGNVPNQDSTRVEFDEGNLFSDGRSPGHDVFELGTRLNIGLRGTSTLDNGTRVSWELGRILRPSTVQTFSVSSGLSDRSSDWLLASHINLNSGLDLIARGVLADNGDVRKTESRLNWQNERAAVNATYTWLKADALENRPTAVSELALDWQYGFKDYWTFSSDLRYDFGVSDLAKVGVGLKYENECASVDLSVSRRLTSSTTFQSATDFGLTVSLTGYGSGAKPPVRKCGI